MRMNSLLTPWVGSAVGLGLAEVFAPRTVARVAGLSHDHHFLLRSS